MVFDFNMEVFLHNARLLAGGTVTDTPETITFARVLSFANVRVAFTLELLKYLKVKASDIQNA